MVAPAIALILTIGNPKCQALADCNLGADTQDLMSQVMQGAQKADSGTDAADQTISCDQSPDHLSCLCLPGTSANDPAMSSDGMALSVNKQDQTGHYISNSGHKIPFPLTLCNAQYGCVSDGHKGWVTIPDPQPKNKGGRVPVDAHNQPIYLPASFCYQKSFIPYCYFPHKSGQPNATACPTYSGSWFYGGQVYLSLNERLSENIDHMIKILNAMRFSPAAGQHVEASYHVSDAFQFLLTFHSPDYKNDQQWATWGQVTHLNDSGGGKQALVLMPLSALAEYIDNSFDQTISEKYKAKPDKDGNVTETYKPERDRRFDPASGNWAPDAADHKYIKGVDGDQVLAAKETAVHNLAEELRTLNYDDSVPNEIKLPIEFLGTIQAEFYGKNSSVFSKDQLAQSLINMLQVLRLNGLIPSGASDEYGQNEAGVESEMTNPAKNVIDLVFARLLGCDVTVDLTGNVHYPTMGCSTGESLTQSNNIEGLMKEIYSIGDDNQTLNGGIVKGQFDMISQAQQVGDDIISTITQSVTTIMSHMSGVMSGNIQQSELWALGGIGAALGAAASPIGSMGPVMVGVTQLRIQLLGVQQMFSFSQSLMWLPLVIFLFSALFMVGVSFSIIMPLTPFLLFWSGQVAWAMGAVEAMVAAPLLLFALALPGGNGEWGHAVPGIKMLLNVIFRPVLMVIGLFVSISLTYVLLHYSTHAFHFAYLSLINKKTADVYTSGILSIC